MMSKAIIGAVGLVAAAAGGYVFYSGAGENAGRPGASQDRELTGEEIYDLWCAACHNAGPGHPGTLRIEARNEGMPALRDRPLNDAIIEMAVRDGFLMMPPFRKTEISDEELQRLTQYLVDGEND